MEFLALLLFVAACWLLVSPFVVFSLWGRVSEVEERIKRLQKQADSRTEPTRAPPLIPVAITVPYESPQVRAAAKARVGVDWRIGSRASGSSFPRNGKLYATSDVG